MKRWTVVICRAEGDWRDEWMVVSRCWFLGSARRMADRRNKSLWDECHGAPKYRYIVVHASEFEEEFDKTRLTVRWRPVK